MHYFFPPLKVQTSDYCNVPKFLDRHVWAKERSSLIRVYTVCHSICIVWTHYSMKNPYVSNFRIITVHFSDVQFLDRHVWAKERSSLIRVYTVCHSICIVWTHYSMKIHTCQILGLLQYIFQMSNFWTDMSEQRRGAVWSGSTLFAIPSASFGHITPWKIHTCQILGLLQYIFQVSNFWTDMSEQRRGAVWSGSTLFAIPSASFGHITLWKIHTCQILGLLQYIFQVSNFWTDMSEQRRGAVWSGSTLFAIPSALFGHITLWKIHTCQILGLLHYIFQVSNFLEVLQ